MDYPDTETIVVLEFLVMVAVMGAGGLIAGVVLCFKCLRRAS